MAKGFEIGAYYHKINEINIKDLNHVTILEPHEAEHLKRFHQQYPKIKISLTFEKKGYGRTLLAHQGMDLAKECRSLVKKGEIKVALPGDVKLLKSFDLRSLGALGISIDLMAFDYCRPQAGGRTNFHTKLFGWEHASIADSLQYLHDQGIPSTQVSLGLTRFGIMFKNVEPGMDGTGYGEVCQGEQLEKPEMRPEEVTKYLDKAPSSKLFYTSLKGCFQSFIYNLETGDWISLDDELTLQSKKEWARRHHLRGVFFY